MDRLWAPWRMAYVSGASKSDSCLFCAALAAGDDRASLILCRRPQAFLILNAYPYASGHLMAVVGRHVGLLEELTSAELSGMMALVQDGLKAVTAAYRPHGFNIGVNQGRVAGAGVDGHLHVHVVPRWEGDTNFMTVVGDARVLPEALETTFAKLSPAFST